MIRIAISTAAFDAISATLPVGSIGFEMGSRMRWATRQSVPTGAATRSSSGAS